MENESATTDPAGGASSEQGAATAPQARAETAGLSRRVTAVVVTYWTGPVLLECLPSILAQPEVRQLVIVNNGNPKEITDRLQELAVSDCRVLLVDPGRNTGFGSGCNLGASRATEDYIALINPDCVLHENTLGRILDVFAARPDAWVCGGRLQHPDGTEQRGGRRNIFSPWRSLVELLRLDLLFPNHPAFQRHHMFEDETIEQVGEVPTVSGAFMVTPTRVYRHLGGMDDNMFLHFEDADFCVRAAQGGGKVLYCGHVPIPHHLSTSDVSRTFIEWHKTRSSSYYFFKHFHGSYPYWALALISTLLWTRFVVVASKLLISDLPGIIRRLRRR